MRTCLLLVFLFFFSTAYSQHAVVAANKMNVLYIGVDNPISIAANNYSCKDLVVEISHGTITQNEDNSCRYTAKVTTPGRVSVNVKNKKGKLLEEVDFRVKRIPDPKPHIGTINNYHGTSEKYLKWGQGLIAVLENFDFDINFQIASYTMATCQNGQLYAAEVMGSLFTDEVKEIINQSVPGNTILFDNIRCYGSDGYIRRLEPLAINIGYYIRKDNCKGGLFDIYGSYPADTAYVLKIDPFRRWQVYCDCEGIDEASGNLINGKKSGWWNYKKINSEDTILVRQEYYNADTLKQIFYKDGNKAKEQMYINGELVGNYLEYHTNGKIKLNGFYTVAFLSNDTIHVIDPVTLEEKLEVLKNYSSQKSGTWQYFNEGGMLIKEEKYLNGKVVK
jgi:hypothetical protein